MRLPNLNALRMFESAARHQNFRIAAEELHVTQGAVAQQVRRLEQDLGEPLFVRKPRGLVLSEAGAAYHTPIAKAFGLIADATANLGTPTQQVTLSVTPSFAAKWLVSRLGRFAQNHPAIDIQIVASDLLDDLDAVKAGVAVRQTSPPHASGLNARKLSNLDLLAVCSPRQAHRLGRVKNIDSLAGTQLIEDGHRHWQRLLGADHQARLLQFNQTALAMDAAISGQGIALAPRILAQSEISLGHLVPVWRPPDTGPGGFYLVWSAKTRPVPARQTVIDWILAEMAADE